MIKYTMCTLWFRHQAGEGSTGSGSSCGGGGATGMKSTSRQRSPGAVVRTGDTMDESNISTITADTEEIVPNIQPLNDDEGVRFLFKKKKHSSFFTFQFLIIEYIFRQNCNSLILPQQSWLHLHIICIKRLWFEY